MTVAGATALSVETSTKVPTPGVAGDARHHARGERVVADGLDRVGLHQPDVLVGGGVEDDGGRCSANTSRIRSSSLQSASTDDGVEHVAVLDQLALDLEQVVLGVVEQDEPARADARDLAAQLGADRAAGAGDEHDAAGEVLADALDLHPHRLAAEDVLDLDLAHLAHQPAAGLQQLEDRRHRAHRHAALAARGDDLARAACPAPTGSRSAPRPARRRRARGRARRCVPSTSSPRSMRTPCLRGSSSTKPTGR